MLIRWRRESRQVTEAGMPDPGEVRSTAAAYRANNRLSYADNVRLAGLLGLSTLDLASFTPDALGGALRRYGPLWASVRKPRPDGRGTYGHIVVIVGVGTDAIYVHDPEPVGVGSRGWKPYSWLDVGSKVARVIMAQFMHCPA